MLGVRNEPRIVRSRTSDYWRRGVFWIWVVASIVVALIAMIGGPLVSTDGSDGTAWIALVSPIAMAVFVLTGVTWLVLLMFSRRQPRSSAGATSNNGRETR